jgi:cytochrome c oxidase accessory protein FixG
VTFRSPPHKESREGASRQRGLAVQDTSGRHQRMRHLLAALFVVTFMALPWIRVEGLPFVRFELHTGHYFLLGKVLPASSLINVVLLVLGAALSLGLVSSLWGRLWCGYACPQGLFVDLGVRALERFWEGPALARARLARTRSSFSKWTRRAGLQGSLLFLSAAFAFGVIAYFADPALLLHARGGSLASLWAVGALIAVLAYVDAAVLRHRFCTTLCPYARLQALLVDEGTRQIGYDFTRGEPRGRGTEKGDCIDCQACVRVCPTGIDIRQGVGQLECVACARCLDVCEGVMTTLGRPKGLIRYDTEGGFQGVPQKRGFHFRPRPFLYASALALVLGGGAFRFAAMPSVQASVVNITPNGFVREGTRVKNLLRVRISNLSGRPATFSLRLSPETPPTVRIDYASPWGVLLPGESAETTVLVSKEALAAQTALVHFVLEAREDATLVGQFSALFSGPASSSTRMR